MDMQFHFSPQVTDLHSGNTLTSLDSSARKTTHRYMTYTVLKAMLKPKLC